MRRRLSVSLRFVSEAERPSLCEEALGHQQRVRRVVASVEAGLSLQEEAHALVEGDRQLVLALDLEPGNGRLRETGERDLQKRAADADALPGRKHVESRQQRRAITLRAGRGG